jgi:drug/metabolite transporter (DMT)-like permease
MLTAYAVGMSGGQVLFKAAAIRLASSDGALVDRLFGLLLNIYFLAALVLYASLTLLWVWILSLTSLSRAYPFVALALALTPLMGNLFFDETLSPYFIIGLVLILVGLFFIVSG